MARHRRRLTQLTGSAHSRRNCVLGGATAAAAGRRDRPAARAALAGAACRRVGAAPVPAPVRAVAAPEVRRRLHRPADPAAAGRSCCSPGPSTPRRSSPATPRSSTPARATRSSARSWASTRCCSRTRAEHKRARKLLMPAFNGHALRGYQALVTELARAEVDRWHAGRGVPLARPDERAHPRGDPAGRLRRDRRARGWPSCGRGSTRPSTSARRSCSAGATRGCSGSARGSAPSTTSTSSTG